MAINYTQSFQSGELSRKMDARSDLDSYKTGCRELTNFYVLPQGGVERRTGTEFINLTGDEDSIDGANSARLFPFDFSDTAKYVVEVGTSYIKIFNGIAETDGTYLVYEPSGTVPAYTATELHELQFVRRYDTMIITHRNHEPLLLQRLTVTPTFSVSEIDYVYPPLRDMNVTATSLKPNSSSAPSISVTLSSYNSGTGALVLSATSHGLAVNDKVTITGVTHSGGEVTITDAVVTVSNTNDFTIVINTGLSTVAVSNGLVTKIITQIQTYSDNGSTLVANVINNEHINSVWGLNYVRSSGNRQQTININTDATGAEIDVSFSNYSVNTSGDLTGTVTIQRSTDGGSNYSDLVILGTADGTTAGNIFSYASTVAEDKNTKIRIKVSNHSGGTLGGTVIAQEQFLKGLIKITSGILGSTVSKNTYTTGTGALKINATNISTNGLTNGDKVTITGVTNSGTAITINDVAVSSVNANDFTVTIDTGLDTANIAFSTDAIIQSCSRVNIEILSPLGGTTATIFWSEAAFSDFRKFPIASEFYQNRLFFTGSQDDPATIFGSVFDDIFNFLTGSTSDMSIKRIPDTAAEAKSLIGKKDLFMGTDGGIVSIKSVNADQLISSTNINTEIQNSYGSSLVQPVIANDVVVYLQGNKLKLRELVYSRDNDVFVGNDLNLLSEDITGTGVRQIFVQQNPDQIIWCIKEDGTACILTYDRTKSIMGWANIETTGTIESGTVLSTSGEDAVWLVVKRQTTENPVTSASYTSGSGALVCASAGIQAKGLVNGDKVTITGITKTSDGSAVTAENLTVSSVGADAFTVTIATGLTAVTLTNASATNILTSADESKIFNTYAVEKFQSRSDATWYVDSGSSVTANNPTSLSVGKHLEGETVQILFDGSFHSTATVYNGAVSISNDFPVWKANKAYNKDETVINSGTVYNAKAAFTSGGAFSASNWNTNSSTAIAGLQFISTLKPMPIEPALSNRSSQSRVKAVAKMVVRFLNTKGAQVGESGRQLTSFPVVKTTDTTGQVVPLKTDSIRFFVGSDFEREKLLEIKQDLPYPMTVLSVASNVNVEGA